MDLKRVFYSGLIEKVGAAKGLMEKLPENFTDVNMLRVSPMVTDVPSVDISSLEHGRVLSNDNINLPDGAKILDRELPGALAFLEFSYDGGEYRILQ